MRIAVLNNLRAGRSGRLVSEVLSLLRQYPDVLHAETQDIAAVPEALAELAGEEVDLLVVNGGDGSLQHTLTELLARDPTVPVPLVAPLRGGRTNTSARDLGGNRNPLKGLAGLLEAAKADRLAERFVERAVLRVAFDKGHAVQYGMFFGAGLIRRAIALTHRLFPPGRSQGVLGAGLMTGALVLRLALRRTDSVLAPDKLQIVLDGEPVREGEFRLALATTLDHQFLDINPFWGSGPAPVRFTCIAASAKGMRSAALGLLRGRPGPHVTPKNGYVSRNVECAKLRLDCGFTIDGELFEPEPDEITLGGDRRITFVRA